MRGGAVVAAGLVGREAEMAELDGAVAAACQGRLQTVLIEGPAGIGKSRLLAEAGSLARAAGMSPVAGRCEELGATRSFGVLADALGCRRDAADQQRRRIGIALLDDAPHRGAFGSGAEHFRLAEDFGDLLESLAVVSPVLVAVDDLQWADPSTIYTLRLIMRRLADLPVLLVAGLRPLPRTAELRQLVERAIDEGGRPIWLEPLDRSDVVQLAAMRLGAEPGDQLASFLDGAGGNPLFVTELVDGLIADDAIASSAGVAELVRRTLPPDLRLTMLRRIAYLSEDASRLLRVAAVLGQTFFVSDLAVVAGMPLLDVLAVVDEWTAAGLVVPQGDAMAFRHDVIREALHDDLPPAYRTALHLEAARALRAAGAPVTRVAQHYAVAASPGDQEAVGALREAARAASRAPTTRAELLRRALELGPQAPELDEILVELADALVWAGEHAEARRLADQALAAPLAPPLRRRARQTIAYTLWMDLRHDDLLAHTSRWLAEGLDGETERALWDVYRAWAYHVSRRSEAPPLRELEQALAVADNRGDDFLAVHALILLAYCALNDWRFPTALDYGMRAVALAERNPDPEVQRLNAHVFASGLLLFAGRFDDADQLLEAGARLREATGALWGLPIQLTNAAIIHHSRGRFDDAIAAARAAIETAGELGVHGGLEVAYGVLSSISIWRGDFDAAERQIHDAEDALQAVGGLGAMSTGTAARLYLARGEFEKALRGIGTEFNRVPRYSQLLFALEVLPVLLEAGERELANQIVTRFEQASAGRTQELAAFVSAARAMVDGAPDRLASAAQRCLDFGLFRGAFAGEYAAAVLARSGRVDEARRFFLRVVDIYEDAGASWLSARARGAMRAAGLPTPRRFTRRRAKSGWEALTDAERSVVTLAADGLTNPQIAERLVVSRHTVHSHMTHALTKLGLTSRRQLPAAVANAPAQQR